MPPEPRATYRVQLHRDFTLDDAAAIVDYLAELGISHLYCSPYLQARSGSAHGYDVVDHSTINRELGGAEALDRLIEALSKNGMRHILDVVPNHMTITEKANRWWWDVLKNGPHSEYASFFDINWDPAEERLRHSILMPILGDHYGRVLEKGEIQLDQDPDGEIVVRYYDHLLPVSPGSIEEIGDEEIATTLRRLNEDLEALHALLEIQYYRLAYWRAAGRELNYRRFFAINDLAALRMDNPEVFERVHELVLEMVRDERLDGLRIDHIDGLRYPTRYLQKLRSAAPDAYLCVEKILEPTESLPDWPIEGTTGYEFLNLVGGVAVDPDAVSKMTQVYERFIGETVDIEAEQRSKKLLLIDTEFGGDFERLTDLFVSVCEINRQYRDYTRSELREALRETAASFPVYRTYVDPEQAVRQTDERYVEEAIADARAARPDLDGELFDLLASILLLRVEGPEAEALAVRFQQSTGPVVAKGIEDTFFYTYNRLIALNEVGGDPARFGTRVEEFHAQNAATQASWPLTMLTSSTHDTKRSEDMRARIALLSEMPERWGDAVTRWSAMNAKHKRNDLPDRNSEYLFYQTLVGAWPLGVRRAEVFMQKAAREAKTHTSWMDPNPAFESALRGFVERVMADRDFEGDLEDFTRPLIDPGRIASLSQTLLKLTAPGVPDFYQGCEAWNLSLVDPDNRRQVDYEARRALLTAAKETDAVSAWADREQGLPKIFLIYRALRLRAGRPDAFGAGSSYEPLTAAGEHAHRVVAFVRGDEVMPIVPRLLLGLRRGWDDTTLSLPEGTWLDVLSDDRHSGTCTMEEVLSRFPVALLVRTDA